MTENELSKLVIGAAIEVHKELGGPGLLEDVYEEALCEELGLRGVTVQRQVSVPVAYKGRRMKRALLLDVLVNEKLIVEVKATEAWNPIFGAQLLTYLRMSDKRLGLVINFGEKRVTDGVHRVVNGL